MSSLNGFVELFERTVSTNDSSSGKSGGGGGSSSGGSGGSSAPLINSGSSTAMTLPMSQNTTEELFGDISDYGWAKDAIVMLAGKNVINGYPDGTFRPSANVTRAEFVAMLVRGFKLSKNDISVSFDDVFEND